MRKYQTVLSDERPRRRRSRSPAAFAIGLLLLVSPVVYEGGVLLLARWQSMTGSYWEPKTPILSALSEHSAVAKLEFWTYTSRIFNSGPWRASTAVPFALLWAVMMAVVFLRKVH